MSLSKRPEYHIDLRHDFIFVINGELEESQVKAIKEDLEDKKFNCALRRSEEESKEWQLLVGLNDQEKILREAEYQHVLVEREYSN